MKATIELTDTIIDALASDKAVQNLTWPDPYDQDGVLDINGAYAAAYAQGMKDLLELIKTETNNQN